MVRSDLKIWINLLQQICKCITCDYWSGTPGSLWPVCRQMIWYVHNISMNDHYKFWSIHIHTQNIIDYLWWTFSGIRKKIAHREREGLNGIRFESLFGVRPRSLAQIAGITYARRSPRFALTPELYFPIIFVGIIIIIMLTALDSKLYLLAVQNIFPLTGKTHTRR